jgi:ABC-type transport system involved in multi-copper enzyme maturation permease subunit
MMDATNQILQEHHSRWLEQALARRNFASVSPAVIYQRACEATAGTGINRCADLYGQVKRYGADLKEFIRSRDLEDPESLHLIGPEHNMASSWRAISHNPVDFDTVPKFQERDLALGKSLTLAIWDIGLLVLFNFVFFAAAFVSFLRYDVR